MCLIVFAYKVSPKYPLILIANRDEFYNRPTRKAHYWDKEMHPEILAGKDLKAGGTWMWVSKNRKWAALTNYRDIENIKNDAPTRGDLVPHFLKSKVSGYEYLLQLKKEAQKYNGFNLLVGDENDIFHYSNISDKITKIQPGIHGVSNALLNTPWPKLKRIKEILADKIQINDLSTASLFNLLKDKAKAAESQLPITGLSQELEKEMSSIFIDTKGYGTRCSTLLFINEIGEVKFAERGFDNENPTKVEDGTFWF